MFDPATFDLERFLSLDPPPPTADDVAIFRRILREIESVPPETTAARLERTDDDGKTKRTVEYPPGKEKSLRNRLHQGRGGNENQGLD